MCIQDNPRYIKLVGLGMPPDTMILYSYTRYKHTYYSGVFESVSFYDPERAQARLFDLLESYYGNLR